MDAISEKVQEMISHCCPELKEAGQAWLDDAGTEREAAATERLLAEIGEDVTPIDGLVAFAGSDHAKEIFGAEKAAAFLAHANELKAAGAAYCDCPACTAALAVKELLQK